MPLFDECALAGFRPKPLFVMELSSALLPPHINGKFAVASSSPARAHTHFDDGLQHPRRHQASYKLRFEMQACSTARHASRACIAR
jgi:hypothetical protein